VNIDKSSSPGAELTLTIYPRFSQTICCLPRVLPFQSEMIRTNRCCIHASPDRHLLARTHSCLLAPSQAFDWTQTRLTSGGGHRVSVQVQVLQAVLMRLFEASGNSDIEGVDIYSACYGGTSSTLSIELRWPWCHCSSRGHSPLYKPPACRTGGARCVAMFVKPDAPLVLGPGLRGSCMQHAYDFH